MRDPEPRALRSSRDLVLALRLVRHLDAPGSERLWFVFGLPLFIVGVAVLPVLTVWDDFRSNTGSFDRTGTDWGYAVAAAAAVIGIVLCVVGDARHTQDPGRRAFEARRRPLALTLYERAREARRRERR